MNDGILQTEATSREVPVDLDVYCQSKLAVRERKCVVVGRSAVSDFIVTATPFKLLYFPNVLFSLAFEKIKPFYTYFTVFRAVTSCGLVMVSTFRREACYLKLKAADSSAAMAPICHTAQRHGSENHYLDTAMRNADLTWLGTYCADIGRPVLSLDLVLMQKDTGYRAYTYPSMLRCMH